MKHIIIGTAGHIDHGKTSLIKALTGRETDTLKEEQDRGISINLGFTFFDLPSGRRAGIIDVPGHEKFVKNMLAGVSGVDMVILVIAADEGMMPQTKEHLEILQLLNVKKGIIALTKVDMVQKDWLDMIEEDIKEQFKDTFLENSPIYKVSSKTKEGIKDLVDAVDKITEEVVPKDTEGHFRLPVDRVFSVSGFGTVVTGTIISGNVRLGDTLEVYPSKVLTKVRSIQIHGKSVEVGEAGQRCAINLSNVKVSEVGRGCVVAAENIMEPSMIIDCKLYYLKSMDRPLVNRQRVRLYHGTNEILCRVIIMDKEEINPGESAYVQLRLESTLTAQRNDRYVIRNYSPMFTIGGGVIIEPVANKGKRFEEKYIEEMKLKESGETESILENTVSKLSKDYPEIPNIIKALGKNEENIQDKLEKLVNQGNVIKLISLERPIYVHKGFIELKTQELEKILDEYHKNNPLKSGMSKEEIKTKVFGKNVKQKIYDEILSLLEKKSLVKVTEKYVCKFDFQIKLTCEQERIKNKIIHEFKEGKLLPPKFADIVLDEKDKNSCKMVYDMLLDNEVLVKVAEDCIFLKEYYDEAKEVVVSFIKKNGKLTAAEARELLNSNRKFVIGLLENFDYLKITKRVENERVLYNS